MQTFLRLALSAAAFLALPAFSHAPAHAHDAMTVEHVQGTTEIHAVPERVITFDLAALHTLDALGIEVIGVPEFPMPSDLEKYAGDGYEKVGSLFEPDYEAVNALAPDLVIVAARSSGAYGELSNIAPTIDVTNDWADFAGTVKANSLILGEIFGKTAEVEAMIAAFDAQVDAFQSEADTLGTALILLTSGGEVTAYGPGSRFGIVHDTLGVTPAIADVEAATHGDAISFEFLLETDPDWLIVLDRDASIGQSADSARQILDNEIVHQTKAWQTGQIVYVDSARWYITNGGIANFNAMVSELADAMLAGD